MIPDKISELKSGVPGHIAIDEPYRAETLIADATDPADLVYGRAFTRDLLDSDVAKPGLDGGGAFAGILVDPLGSAGEQGTLEPQTPGTFLTMGTAWVRIKRGMTWAYGQQREVT